MFTLEDTYESATPVSTNDHWKLLKLPLSLPYVSPWENEDGRAGLIQDGNEFYNVVHQRYANDTLYTLLKTNQNAKERFFELVDQLQQFTDNTDQSESPKTPVGRLLKLLKDRFTTYLLPIVCQLDLPSVSVIERSISYADLNADLCNGVDSPASPPPQK
ncbi:hypothetical protein GCM10028806_15320 [Spirosoma terrae]|uniref:hypothetical protein n=1 Tax=Spirosoma terrae TaxID=1968276 RepID=UPI00293BDB2B|nr:hypothetical protein [Spirosoma terrae]